MKTNLVTIKGQDYNIEFFNYETGFLGKTDINKKAIFLDNKLDNYDLKPVIFHELLHAYFYECGLVHYADDEILVNFLDSVFYDLMRDIKIVSTMKKGVK